MRALYGTPAYPTPHADALHRGRPGRMPNRTSGGPDTPRGNKHGQDADSGGRDNGGHPDRRDHTPDQRHDDASGDIDGQPGTEQPQEKDSADRLKVCVDRPAFQDPFAKRPPDRYGQPLGRPDGTRVPCLNGCPDRRQAEQGRLDDCGIIATLGAVASQRPDEIARRVTQQPDGNYRVLLNEARWTEDGTAATGQMIEMTVTPDLPVFNRNPDEPAFAPASEAAWAPVLEKAVAGLDQTWTTQRQDDWAGIWQQQCENDAADEKVKCPRTGPPPDGYARLNQGSISWERAELLTQLTGEDSVVRTFPDDPRQLTRVLVRQLQDSKPVLVSSRAPHHDDEIMPFDLEDSHAYELVAVSDDKFVLRNPWNLKHPEAMRPSEFAANMQPFYATLK